MSAFRAMRLLRRSGHRLPSEPILAPNPREAPRRRPARSSRQRRRRGMERPRLKTRLPYVLARFNAGSVCTEYESTLALAVRCHSFVPASIRPKQIRTQTHPAPNASIATEAMSNCSSDAGHPRRLTTDTQTTYPNQISDTARPVHSLNLRTHFGASKISSVLDVILCHPISEHPSCEGFSRLIECRFTPSPRNTISPNVSPRWRNTPQLGPRASFA